MHFYSFKKPIIQLMYCSTKTRLLHWIQVSTIRQAFAFSTLYVLRRNSSVRTRSCGSASAFVNDFFFSLTPLILALSFRSKKHRTPRQKLTWGGGGGLFSLSFLCQCERTCDLRLQGFSDWVFFFYTYADQTLVWKARSPGGKSNVRRSHFFCFLLLFFCCFFLFLVFLFPFSPSLAVASRPRSSRPASCS